MENPDNLTVGLRRLRSAVAQCQDQDALNRLDDALRMSSQERVQFLVSNELWGGAGSIADQTGIDLGRSVRREVESALIDLGEEQIRRGVVNSRTALWVEAFKTWRRDGI